MREDKGTEPKQLTYKDYNGSIEYSVSDCIYYGKVLNIPDLIVYEAKEGADLQISFELAVDDYLETIAILDKK